MIPDTLFDALNCGARAAACEVWMHAHSVSGAVPDEIDHIYAMMTKGIQELGSNWSPVFCP
jgi:hypothetical protein